MSAHRVNFRRYPNQRHHACNTCGATCPTLRDRQVHADVAEGRTTDTAEEDQ